MILTPLQKFPKNGEDWGKLNVAKGFKKLPKVLNIAHSGHTDGVLGIRTRGCMMVSPYESTELWRPPFCTSLYTKRSSRSQAHTLICYRS